MSLPYLATPHVPSLSVISLINTSYDYMATKDSFFFSLASFIYFVPLYKSHNRKLKLPFSRIFFHSLISVYDHIVLS